MTDRAALNNMPIGVFDSGVGGLTVLNEIRRVLPGEDLIYLGDTARVPYGTKSSVSITRYAEQALRALLSHKIKALVIACNTVSAVALDPLRAAHPELPIFGVVEPGAAVACRASKAGHIGVIATESTINNLAYHKAIISLRPDATVRGRACSLFVALAEEGWHEGELVEGIVRQSLGNLLHVDGDNALDTLVLGCTHFPALRGAIQSVVGGGVLLVDSAVTTADALAKSLTECNLCADRAVPGHVRFLVTDGPERFARVAPNFFSEHVDVSKVELVDIQHFGSDQAI
ncbi:glutamate racemase [Nitrincola sp. MINF-07-Sa-05]|uniref:glutamate racemase n=1 Tax=Nitrincola salilacus TaxID=3400273 RepID=UPI003917B859